MMDDDPQDLLRRYSEDRSEEAFRLLVRQHSPLVFGTALRKLTGDQAAAQDVMQEVFTLLARKAAMLGGVVLAGWLYRQTCRRAANHVRTENRRKQREKTAMEHLYETTNPSHADHLATELDTAMLALPAADRDALVLRFFDAKDYLTVGHALGISDEAARKRVKRALDRLAGIFKRKGIAIGSASLETTMQGFGAISVPEDVVSRVCAHALKAAPPVVSSPWLAFLKPIAAGVIAASVVAGTSLAIHRHDARATPPAPPVTATKTRAERNEPTFLPANASLESIIAEIKRVQAGPATALTALRLRATLDRIPTDQTEDFITLANERLNRAERAATYYVVLRRWLAAEPDAALTFVLRESAGNRVEPWTSGNLVNNLFEDWMRQDLKASQAWLLKHWEDPTLLEKAMVGSLRNFLSAEVAGELFDKAGKAALIEFIQAIPGERERQAAFNSLVGTSLSQSKLRYSTNQKRIEFFDLLKEFPDSAWRTSASRNFLSNWAEENPEEFEKAAAAMAPADRFQMALGQLAAQSAPGEMVPSLSGGWTQYTQPIDRSAREAAAMRAGVAAGLPREEILGGIGAVLLERLPQSAALAWLDAHRGEVTLDDLLAEKARKVAVSGAWTENVLPEMAAIHWASRIADSELRLSLCRGAFRKLCAEKPADAAVWLAKPDVPPDLLEPFRSILEESR